MKIDFNLYLITDRKLFSDKREFTAAVRKALKAGVRAIQLREKDLETRELLKLAYMMKKLTLQYKSRLFINDRFDIALAVNAEGVHLTQNSIPVEAVRKAVQRKLIIGVSTHSLKEAREAEKGGADFITFGPVYNTPSKLKYGSPLGIDALKEVSRKVHTPVFAIGGIRKSRIKDIQEAGAHGPAVIREIFASGEIQGKAKELINLLGA
ncbi:MAG: thiamine phosphate synthase [Nitrospiraceae bacterium]|nr:MAG: thiamine phosphate synthase [Nitrospiraceae bacterium]